MFRALWKPSVFTISGAGVVVGMGLTLLLALVKALPLTTRGMQRRRSAISCVGSSPFGLRRVIIATAQARGGVGGAPIVARVVASGRVRREKANGVRSLLARRIPKLGFRRINCKADVSVRKLNSGRVLFLVSNRHVTNRGNNGVSCSQVGLCGVSRVRVIGKTSSTLCNSRTVNKIVGVVAHGTGGGFRTSTNVHCTKEGRRGCGSAPGSRSRCGCQVRLSGPGLGAGLSLKLGLNGFAVGASMLCGGFSKCRLFSGGPLIGCFPTCGAAVARRLDGAPADVSKCRSMRMTRGVSCHFDGQLGIRLGKDCCVLGGCSFRTSGVFRGSRSCACNKDVSCAVSSGSSLMTSIRASRCGQCSGCRLGDNHHLRCGGGVVRPHVVCDAATLSGRAVAKKLRCCERSLFDSGFRANIGRGGDR